MIGNSRESKQAVVVECADSARRLESVEHEHALEKAARNLACDLPINPLEAERICRSLKGDDLSLGAVGAWCQALEDALDDSVFGYGRSEQHTVWAGDAAPDSECARHLVCEKIHQSLVALQAQGNALIRALGGEKPPQSRRIQGASAGWSATSASAKVTGDEAGLSRQQNRTLDRESGAGG